VLTMASPNATAAVGSSGGARRGPRILDICHIKYNNSFQPNATAAAAAVVRGEVLKYRVLFMENMTLSKGYRALLIGYRAISIKYTTGADDGIAKSVGSGGSARRVR